MLKGVIIHRVVSKANGMFQWAKCQLDHLCLLNNEQGSEKGTPALDTLPKDLFEKDRGILDRVNDSTPGNRSLVKRTLQWILFSEELMPGEKLAMVVTVEINSDYVN